MLSLPFNKWTLKFHSPEYEIQFEEYANNVKAICFRSINAFASLVAFACLIIFIVQEKSVYLIVIAASILGVCFIFSVLSEKLKPLMRLIFSSLHIAGTCIYIIVNLSGVDIPAGILGYSLGCSTMGIIQYSDNRLKMIYVVATPCILLGVFNIYKINYLHLVFYAFTSMIFTGVLAYMNEYTSRMAFALNIIANKQKDIINEFVSDALFAISFDDRKNQFILEFQNIKFEKDFDIKETDQMKVFLRSSFFVYKSSISVKTRSELHQQRKQQSLEEYLYEYIQRKKNSPGETEYLPEICFLTFDAQQQQIYKRISIQLKIIDYGKPLMLLIIKSNIAPQIHDYQEEKLAIYKHSMIKLSQQLASRQTYIYKATKKLKVSFSEQKYLQQILCLNLQQINLIRNQIIYFSKDKLCSTVGNVNNSCLFSEYINTIGQYFYSLSNQYNRKFKMANLTSQDLYIKLNTQWLSQIIINLFECVLKDSIQREVITLLIREEFNLNPLKIKNNKSKKNYKNYNIQKMDSDTDIKLLSFSFYHYSNSEVQNRQTFQEQFDDENYNKGKQIPFLKSVSDMLLGLLGPYNNSFQIQQLNEHSGSDYVNKIIFYIYQDSSLVEPSFITPINYQDKK